MHFTAAGFMLDVITWVESQIEEKLPVCLWFACKCDLTICLVGEHSKCDEVNKSKEMHGK